MACTPDQHPTPQQQQQQQQQTEATSLCEECKLNTFKYKCPGCSRRTCSLPCVKSHKNTSGCSGKRDRTHFVPISQFDDSTLLSDFYLLEDAKRVADSAKRMRKDLSIHPSFSIPSHLMYLQNLARKRRTKLLILPAGMSRREKNKTRSTKKGIHWTIEWRFHFTDVILLEHGVHEKKTLRSVVETYLQPSPWRNKLRRYSDEALNNLKFFIRKDQKCLKSPYYELDMDTPLRQLFAGLVILEYPVIHAFLSSDSRDFEVVKRRVTRVSQPSNPPKSEEPITEDAISPMGMLSKVEEIEEDEDAPEPLIIDLLKSSEAYTHDKTVDGAQIRDKLSNDLSAGKSTKCSLSNNFEGHDTNGDDVLSNTPSRDVEILDLSSENFDFDQDLINAYSFLMEENNPDDFLDYNLEDADDQTNVYFADMEELEEGEIPTSD